MPGFETLVTGLAALSAAVTAGVYFAFNVIVMPSLAARGDDSAVDIMNDLNRKILSSAFMPLFFASSLLYLALLVLAASGWVKLAALCYLLGMFAVTAARNVPLNNRLQAGQIDWPRYRRYWCRWNAVRAAGSLLAAIMTAAALI